MFWYTCGMNTVTRTQAIAAHLADDFEFAMEDDGELTSQAAVLRYVAAINEDVTKAEFVAAAVVAGFNAHSAGARFLESRKVSRSYGSEFDKSGKSVALAA